MSQVMGVLPDCPPDPAHQRRLLRLFRVSVIKQTKWRIISRLLGPTDGLRCLDIGSDNGVMSYLLRALGGSWASADLDEETALAIRGMVGSDVLQFDGVSLPFPDAEFDRVVLVDCLEHVADDLALAREVARIVKPGAVVLINVPHRKDSLLRRFRLAIGQTDEAHGHLRPGYTPAELTALFEPAFRLERFTTYSKFFSEAVDTLITLAVRTLKGQPRGSVKGTVVTGADLSRHRGPMAFYTLLYPVVWLIAQADRLLWGRTGYMLIARAVAVERS